MKLFPYEETKSEQPKNGREKGFMKMYPKMTSKIAMYLPICCSIFRFVICHAFSFSNRS